MTGAALRFVTRALGVERNPPPIRAEMDDAGWTGTLEFANHHLLTPALYGALVRQGTLHDLPREVAGYLAHLADANSQRNAMMYRQGIELAARLNTAGIVPVFLKSAADLMEGAAVLSQDGIVGDLDVLVPSDAGAAAAEALAGAGYRPWGGLEPNDHTYADLGRAQDAALVDLHTQVLELGHMLPAAQVRQGATIMDRGGARFGVPAPEDRLLHRLIHDQIQGRGLYTGRLHLGHAWRTAWLLRHCPGTNWSDLAERAQRHGLSTALGVEALAAGLFGAAAPDSAPAMARVLHRWRMLRLAHPNVRVSGQWAGRVIDLYTRMRFLTREPQGLADDS